MTIEETTKLVEMLKAQGVRHYKTPELELEFSGRTHVPLPRPNRLPTVGVLAEEMAPSPEELEAVG